MIEILSYFRLLNIGKRVNLEDYIYPPIQSKNQQSKVFVLCDGVGGEAKGEIASKIVADTFGEMLQNRDFANKEVILSIFDTVILKLKNYIENVPEARNMSTTLTLAFINKNDILVAWSGDSKILHFNKNVLKWQSLDHSLVQHLVNIKEITPEEMAFHPQRNIITQCINANAKHKDLDFYTIENIESGDYLLLASDGLFEQMSIERLQKVITSSNTDKDQIINQHCENQTRDNYSMHLIELTKKSSTSFKYYPPKILGWVVFIILLVLIIGKYYFWVSPSEKRAKVSSVQIPVMVSPKEQKKDSTAK